MIRTKSGSRSGVGAMVHTLKSLKAISHGKRSKEQFQNFFSDEFYKDYPDATPPEIIKALLITWIGGKDNY